MALFAKFPADEVTVLDIAGTVGMTPAAVYYHFSSKEQILIEGMQRFRDSLLEETRLRLPVAGSRSGASDLVVHLVAWNRRNHVPATVFFVNSIGLNPLVEAVRRETRLAMIDVFRDAAKATRGRLSPAESGVIAVALVSLLESATTSALTQDASYRSLGARRFAGEVRSLANRISGVAATE